MNKEFIENALQSNLEENLKKNDNGNTLGGILNNLVQFIETDLNAETDVWLFQSQNFDKIDYIEDSKEALFDFLFNNLESYFNFYINIERTDIEPSGIADIWLSFKVSDKSKELIVDTLHKIKDSLNDISELADVRDIIDIRLPSYSDDFLDNIEITSIKVIMTK